MIDEKSRYYLESVELDEFFTATAARGRFLAESRQIQLSIACILRGARQAFFDKGKLQQALEILFRNAFSIAATGVTLEFSLQTEDEKVVFALCAPVTDGLKARVYREPEVNEAGQIIERQGGELSWLKEAEAGVVVFVLAACGRVGIRLLIWLASPCVV